MVDEVVSLEKKNILLIYAHREKEIYKYICIVASYIGLESNIKNQKKKKKKRNLFILIIKIKKKSMLMLSL